MIVSFCIGTYFFSTFGNFGFNRLALQEILQNTYSFPSGVYIEVAPEILENVICSIRDVFSLFLRGYETTTAIYSENLNTSI